MAEQSVESPQPPRHWRRWWPQLRRWHQAVLVGFVVMTIASLSMVLGPYFNDRTINENPGRALATVTSVGTLRTMVEYQDADGYYRAPSTGLLYPSDLREGQRVWVQYAKDDPNLVKVEGREWTLAIIPALSVWLSSCIIAIILWVVPDMRAQRKRTLAANKQDAPTGVAAAQPVAKDSADGAPES